MTEHQKLFLRLYDFLSEFVPIWNNEILIYHPDSLTYYQSSWIRLLDSLSEEDLWKIDAKLNYDSIKNTPLYDLLIKIKYFVTIDHVNLRDHDQTPANMFFKIKGKKNHEIKSLIPLLKDLKKSRAINQGFDIGGGVGHFSRIISNQLSIPVHCVDQDENFINIGKNIKKRKGKDISHQITLVNESFSSSHSLVTKHFNKDSLLVGLHTCGPLANELLISSAKYNIGTLINFGCCYSKMTNEHQNISHFSKSKPLFLSFHALTLATRAHSELSFSDFALKRRVKSYRYALHLFMKYHLGINEFIGVGDSKPDFYQKPFSDYATFKLNNIVKEVPCTRTLDSFYNSKEIQKEVSDMFLANIIRWQFGRLLEIFLLTDRCLYLEEQGYSVTLKEYFDENISPRNLGIVATL